MERDPDTRAISIVLLLTTLPVIIATLLAGQAFGASATVCLGLSALGIGDLVCDRRACTQLPSARARRRKR